jgi:hypothetical protein
MTTSTKKPFSTASVLAFAEGGKGAAKGQSSGLVPAGDVRLTVNIRDDVHQRLKIRAVQERTTVGELIEAWVEGWK